MHRGSCNCGAVRFTVDLEGPLQGPDACHCTKCRKASGHFFASTDVPRSAVRIEGEELLTWYRSSEKVRRGFCRTCGSQLFWDPVHRDWIGVAMGAFDGPTGTALRVHIFVADKGDYYALNDGLPQHAQLTVHIARPAEAVYAFASDPRNLPRWAAGLARSEVREEGDAWIAEAPFGTVRIRFAPRNVEGVLDHDVTLESGEVVHNPMRVVPSGRVGESDFTFTLIRRPEMSDEQFDEDRRAVEADLQTLKRLLESGEG